MVSMNATACYFVTAMEENTEIARGLQRRDPDLLDHLIEKYQHRLLRYLVHLTGRRELAEDFFQETWIRVLERGRQYDAHQDKRHAQAKQLGPCHALRPCRTASTDRSAGCRR